MTTFSLALSGLLTGLGLIVAIGAQNAYVLRQGIRREHISIVVAICIFSDAVLILAGYFGLSAFLEKIPALIQWMKWAGVAYLTYMGVRSLKNLRTDAALQLSPHDGSLPDSSTPTSISDADSTTANDAAVEKQNSRLMRTVVLTTLSLTWLNPHVYLDTVILLGSIAHQYGDRGISFSLGAILGSVLWFSALGFFAYKLAPTLSSPRAWKIIEVFVAITMFAMAAVLAFSNV